MAAFGIRARGAAQPRVTAASLIAVRLRARDLAGDAVLRAPGGPRHGLVASVLGPDDRQPLVRQGPRPRHRRLRRRVSAGQLIFFPFLTTLAVLVGWRRPRSCDGGHRSAADHPGRPLAARRPGRRRRLPLGAEAGARSRRPDADPGVMRRAVRSSDFWFLAIDVLRLRRDVQRPHRPALHQPRRGPRVHGRRPRRARSR